MDNLTPQIRFTFLIFFYVYLLEAFKLRGSNHVNDQGNHFSLFSAGTVLNLEVRIGRPWKNINWTSWNHLCSVSVQKKYFKQLDVTVRAYINYVYTHRYCILNVCHICNMPIDRLRSIGLLTVLTSSARGPSLGPIHQNLTF